MGNNNIEKLIITAQELIDDSFKLGIKVIESGYQPTTIITLWRGGATVGIVIDELMSYKKIITNHNVLKTSSYKNTEQLSSVKIFGLDGTLDRLGEKEKILIIDDIFDSGNTIDAVIREIDVKTKQVLIEAFIVEADSTFQKALGTRIGAMTKQLDGQALITGSVGGAATPRGCVT